jgi:hypothetical protein
MGAQPGELDDFKSAATAKFTALVPVFQSCTSYWRLGHCFDTVLDYFALVCDQDAEDFGRMAVTQFTNLTGPKYWGGYWYDDHGWWGVAALRASQQPTWFGPNAQQFEKFSLRCWKTMDAMAPTVWKRRPTAGNHFDSLEPRIPGGVWNSSWNADGVGDHLPCDPTLCIDDAWMLCGYQNSVTNLLYLVLAARRYAAYHDDHDGRAADREYGFLQEWRTVTPADDALFDSWPDRLVIRAEVSTYTSGARTREYEPDFIWAGDQGLLLGALVERMSQLPKGGPEYKELVAAAADLLAGTYDRLTTDGILHYWVSPSRAAKSDEDDYVTGIGVYFRYLLHAFQTNADLRELLSDPKSVYPAFVTANAQRAASDPTGQDLVALTNDLAQLVAAVAMLEPPTAAVT